MNNFIQRLYVTFFLLILFILCLYLGQNYILLLGILVFSSLFYEWHSFFLNKNYKFIIFTFLLNCFVIFAIFINYLLFFLTFFLFLIYIYYIKSKNKLNFLYFITIIYFLISFFSFFYYVNNLSNYNEIILLFLIVILFDTLSYIFGNLFKGKKIIPSISPGKTLSGYILGFITSFFIVLFVNSYFSFFNLEIKLLLFILIIIISSIIGDIIESLIKRKLLIKDISNLLPGHGGFFDRFDSFLFVFIIINILNLIY